MKEHLWVTQCCRYKTPLLSEIDKIGIIPDKSCKAGQQVPAGLPLDRDSAEGAARALSHDGCIIQAEEGLADSLTDPERLIWHPVTGTWSP